MHIFDAFSNNIVNKSNIFWKYLIAYYETELFMTALLLYLWNRRPPRRSEIFKQVSIDTIHTYFTNIRNNFYVLYEKNFPDGSVIFYNNCNIYDSIVLYGIKNKKEKNQNDFKHIIHLACVNADLNSRLNQYKFESLYGK